MISLSSSSVSLPPLAEQELAPELRRPALARMERLTGGDLELEVHADVDHDPHGPQLLADEEARAGGRGPRRSRARP